LLPRIILTIYMRSRPVKEVARAAKVATAAKGTKKKSGNAGRGPSEAANSAAGVTGRLLVLERQKTEFAIENFFFILKTV
jgi:hypothetical protein